MCLFFEHYLANFRQKCGETTIILEYLVKIRETTVFYDNKTVNIKRSIIIAESFYNIMSTYKIPIFLIWFYAKII